MASEHALQQFVTMGGIKVSIRLEKVDGKQVKREY
jgi:hypothetical protein